MLLFQIRQVGRVDCFIYADKQVSLFAISLVVHFFTLSTARFAGPNPPIYVAKCSPMASLSFKRQAPSICRTRSLDTPTCLPS